LGERSSNYGPFGESHPVRRLGCFIDGGPRQVSKGPIKEVISRSWEPLTRGGRTQGKGGTTLEKLGLRERRPGIKEVRRIPPPWEPFWAWAINLNRGNTQFSNGYS